MCIMLRAACVVYTNVVDLAACIYGVAYVTSVVRVAVVEHVADAGCVIYSSGVACVERVVYLAVVTCCVNCYVCDRYYACRLCCGC